MILVVEDEASQRELLAGLLEGAGLSVQEASCAEEARRRLVEGSISLVLLDLGLPDIDGFQFLSELRARSEAPIVIVTAKRDRAAQQRGIELGASDYITKPFVPSVALARLTNVLRGRREQGERSAKLRFGPYRLDPRERRLCREGELVQLSACEYALLEALALARGGVLSKSQLFERLDRQNASDERAVPVLIHRLRQKLERAPAAPAYIKTAYGVGYYLEGVTS